MRLALGVRAQTDNVEFVLDLQVNAMRPKAAFASKRSVPEGHMVMVYTPPAPSITPTELIPELESVTRARRSGPTKATLSI
jgi:hypothetical protein